MKDIARVKENIKNMIMQDAPDEDIQAYLKYEGVSERDLQSSSAASQRAPKIRNRDWRDTASEYYTPALEMGGSIGGALVGAGAGTVAAPGPGTVTGGAIGGIGGYAMGKSGAHNLDILLGIAESGTVGKELAQTAKDLKTGAYYETVGGVAGNLTSRALRLGGQAYKALKAKFPALSHNAIMLKAKELLEATRKGASPEVTKETDELLKRANIKTQPTFAQRTGSKASAAAEQTAARTGENMEILAARESKIKQEALENVNATITGGTIGDTRSAVESTKGKLGLQAQAADLEARAMATPTKTAQQSGVDIVTALESSKTAMKGKVASLYEKVPPGLELPNTEIKNGLRTFYKEFNKVGGGPDAKPKAIIRQFLKILKKGKGTGTVKFEKLTDLRSQISKEISNEYAKADPNLKRTKYLEILKDGVDNAMDEVEKVGGLGEEVVQSYREAKKFFVETYRPSFRAGTVNDVLRGGKQASGYSKAYSDIPASFFSQGKMDAADDLVRALGQEKAAGVIRDYATDSFASAAEKGSAKAWVGKHKTVLDKFGLYDEFLQKAGKKEIAEESLARLTNYEKTTASVVLGSDIEKVMPSYFAGKGKRESYETMKRLLNAEGIKGNPAAIGGIKTAMKDWMLKQAEKTKPGEVSVANLKKFLKEYRPALTLLYKDNQKQLVALEDYHKVLEILERNKNVTYSGGSTTAEKIAGSFGLKAIGKNAVQVWLVGRGKWRTNAVVNLAKSFFAGPYKWSQDQIEALFTDALLNPESAEIIMKATKKEFAGAKGLSEQIRSQLIKLGLYTSIESGKTVIRELE